MKNLNTSLKMPEAEEGKNNKTYQDAINDLKDYGYLLPYLVTKANQKLLYNIDKNEFCLEKRDISIHAYKYWAIENSIPSTQTYSIYPSEEFAETSVSGLKVGFDAGEKIE